MQAGQGSGPLNMLAPCKALGTWHGWARGEREGYGEPCDVTSLSLSLMACD